MSVVGSWPVAAVDTKNKMMGTVRCFALFFVFACSRVALTSGSEDAELKDPYLLEVARFAATKLMKNVEDLGLKNTSVLHRIMDANVVPYPQPAVLSETCYLSSSLMYLCFYCSPQNTC